jgi:hypothetical protein
LPDAASETLQFLGSSPDEDADACGISVSQAMFGVMGDTNWLTRKKQTIHTQFFLDYLDPQSVKNDLPPQFFQRF